MPSEDDERSAQALLGSEHPLTRALARERTVALQTAAALAVLPGSVAATVLGVEVAPLFLGATVAVALVYALAWLSLRRTLVDRTRDAIASGDCATSLGIVASERRRLVSRRERERLARCLEQALRDAWSWERTPPPARPLYGTQFLRESAADVSAIVGKLRGRRVRAQGVALVSRLLGDGERSPLYAGDAARLREELRRIRYLLEPRERGVPPSTGS